MNRLAPLLLAVALAACDSNTSTPLTGLVGAPSLALSAAQCTFTVSGTMMTLDADCSTPTSIVIPDGFTLNGAHHTITAVDPGVGSPFIGGVLQNGGTTAYVLFVDIRASGLSVSCKAGSFRLRGILFDGASGSITHSSVSGVNQGASGCQEGNAIEVRNAPFDGTHPKSQLVEIAHNAVSDYQKGGIICNGDVSCSIHHNEIGTSATQANLAANTVQFGFGAAGNLSFNHISGNSWCGPSDFVATAVLLYLTEPGIVVESNQIDGNSDVGIYVGTDGATVSKNTVADVGTDCNVNSYDIGIGDYGLTYPVSANSLTKNKVSGFDLPYDPANPGGKNQVKKVHPSPN